MLMSGISDVDLKRYFKTFKQNSQSYKKIYIRS